MTDGEILKMVEAHWAYTEEIILHQLKLTQRLYIEAMLHGYKHGKGDLKSDGK